MSATTVILVALVASFGSALAAQNGVPEAAPSPEAAAAATPSSPETTQSQAPVGAITAQPVNSKCPVMTDEDALPDFTVPWQGRTIGFCCNKCIRKFQQHPERYLANLPPLATPVSGDDSAAGLQDSAGAPAAKERGRLELFVGRVHPMLVHFPIALLLAAALAEMIGALRGNSGSATSARFCLALGALGAVAAALTGWQRAQAFVPLPGTESHVDIHRWLAVATAGYALLLTLVGMWARERSTQVRSPGLGLFRWGLLLGAALVAVTAHYGGTLVYGAGFPFSD